VSGQIILTNKRWNKGTYNIPSSPILVGLEYVKFSFDVTEMTDPALGVSAYFEISFDDGVTWPTKGNVLFQGGPIRLTDMAGNPVVRTPPFISTHEIYLADPTNTQRRIQGHVVISGGSFKTEVTLETR